MSDSATGPLLEVHGLSVDYGVGDDAVHAVSDASMTLRRGEVHGLAGESGSGKSTLAYGITRLLRAPGVITGGTALFDGTADLFGASEEQLRRLRWSEIAVVMQSAMHALNPVMSIGTQLTDVLRAHRPAMDRHARVTRAVNLLTMVGISADRLRAYPHELSGGMRQRVMIAMALALEPRIVIMDEPTTALDVVTQREILEELASLRERLGFAVLFITHDLSLLLEIADSITIMYAGRIVEQAPAAELFRAPRHPYSLGLLGSFPSLHGRKVRMTGISGSPPDLRHPPGGCPFHPRCKYAMDRCAQEVPVLAPPGTALGRTAAAADLEAGRTVACWLHDPGSPAPVPPELSVVPDLSGHARGGLAAVPRLTAAGPPPSRTAVDSIDSGGTP